jgi:D-alanyl-D-alanine carboxypeptidase (penicillin-binding protein 5/6)
MGYFSCRRLFVVILLIFLLVSPAGAQTQVKKTKAVSLHSLHKSTSVKDEITKKQKKIAKKRIQVKKTRAVSLPSLPNSTSVQGKIAKRQTKATEATRVSLEKLKRTLAESYPEPQHIVATEVSSELKGKLTCRSAYIMDAKTGKVLYDRSADRPGQPASTIKILTGLIAVENLNGREMVKTSAYAANMPASKIHLKKGVFYKAADLINAVLLASANDASVALAEKLAGSEQAFARMMTKKAQSLGAQNTICKSANGLTRPGQQTTASDLAKVFNRAMHNPDFAERMATTQVRTSDGMILRSHNKALWTLDGAVGGKTGYTDAAGKTYVGKFQRGGQAIIVSLLGSASMWTDVATLVEHGFAKQEIAALLPENASDSVQVSQVKQENMAGEHVQYVMLTGHKKKARS